MWKCSLGGNLSCGIFPGIVFLVVMFQLYFCQGDDLPGGDLLLRFFRGEFLQWNFSRGKLIDELSSRGREGVEREHFSGWKSSRRMVDGESKLPETYFTDGIYVITIKIIVVYGFIKSSFNEKMRPSIVQIFRKYSASFFYRSRKMYGSLNLKTFYNTRTPVVLAIKFFSSTGVD